MRVKAIWETSSWFYYQRIFVLISKSKKGVYKSEVFADGTTYDAGIPFRTSEGAKKWARKLIDEQTERGYPPEPLTFEELMERKGTPIKTASN